MLTDILISIFTALIVDPARGAMDRALAAANVPPAAVAEARACLDEAAPRLAARAWNDPWWGVGTVVRVTFGTVTLHDTVAEVAPRCGPVLDRILDRPAGGRPNGEA